MNLYYNEITPDNPGAVITIRKDFFNPINGQGIDIAAEGKYCGVDIIKPDDIKKLPLDTIIIVAAPSAQESAKMLLNKSNRPYILLKGTDAECYNL